jgi:hypothetical protein
MLRRWMPSSPSHRIAMGPSLSPQWAERVISVALIIGGSRLGRHAAQGGRVDAEEEEERQ